MTFLYSFYIATCFGFIDHHQAIYTIIMKIIELYNGSVVFSSTLSFFLCTILYLLTL
jgi:hypothetical protein